MRALGNACDHTGSAARRGVDGKATVEQRHAFTHGEESEPVPVEGRVALVEAVTVVLHDEGRARVGLGDADGHRLGARMFADVGQGLLDDPDQVDLTTRRERQPVVEVAIKKGLDVALLRVLGKVSAKVVLQPSFGLARVPETEDRLPHVLVGLLADIGQLCQLHRDHRIPSDLFASVQGAQP